MSGFEARHTIAHRLREQRRQNGLSIAKLAHLSGISAEIIREYEAATNLMQITHLQTLAKTLGLQLTELLEVEAVPSNLTDEISGDEWQLITWYRRLTDQNRTQLHRFFSELIAPEDIVDDVPAEVLSIPKLNPQEINYIQTKYGLSDRKMKLLQLIIENPQMSMKDLGAQHGFSEQAVYQNMNRIYTRCKAKGRSTLLAVIMEARAELANSLQV